MRVYVLETDVGGCDKNFGAVSLPERLRQRVCQQTENNYVVALRDGTLDECDTNGSAANILVLEYL